jgi:clan AA aspartic protease
MGQVHTDITLRNVGDTIRVECGRIAESAIRETTVQAMADTGALTLTITESVRQALGLRIVQEGSVTYANNTKETCGITEPVEVQWKDRSTSCWAVVVPGEGEVLLGAIPLEGMDLMVDPISQQLVGAHGDQPLYMCK